MKTFVGRSGFNLHYCFDGCHFHVEFACNVDVVLLSQGKMLGGVGVVGVFWGLLDGGSVVGHEDYFLWFDGE